MGGRIKLGNLSPIWKGNGDFLGELKQNQSRNHVFSKAFQRIDLFHMRPQPLLHTEKLEESLFGV